MNVWSHTSGRWNVRRIPVIEAIEQEALDKFRADHPEGNPEFPESHDVDEPPGESP